MFHVNAWGLPYAACMIGVEARLPRPGLDGKSLYELFESERVTLSAGVPTVWQGLLTYVEANDLQLLDHAPHHHRRLGLPAGDDDAPSRSATACKVLHAWGMTEMSPVGTVAMLKGSQIDLTRPRSSSRSSPSRAAPSTAST